MHGRERERRAVLELFQAAGPGAGGVLLLDGGFGTGKSRFLAEVVATATERGFGAAVGQAEAFGGLVPMAPLLAAFDEPSSEAIDSPVVLVERLRARAEALAGIRPVLVALDDLQWADPATLMALRTLQRQLSALPIVWLLARSTCVRRTEAERLFALMEGEGAGRVELGPLPADAVAELIAGFLPAPPSRELSELAAGAAGNPLLLTELLAGLRDEESLQVVGGQTRLVSGRLPERLVRAVTRCLDGLSGPARQVVETAAVLGRAFSPEDVADVLGRTPAGLLLAVQEAIDADILLGTTDVLVFQQDILRKAVLQMLPPPLLQALHHQIGGILLERGGPAMEAAHLLVGGHDGYSRTLARLDQAVDDLLADAPEAAAAVALRAMNLTADHTPQRLARTLRAARAMTEAGRLAEVVELVTQALIQPLQPSGTAQLRSVLAATLLLGGKAADAAREAEQALTAADLSRQARDEARMAMLQAQAGAYVGEQVVRQAEAVLGEPDHHADALLVTATTLLAVASWEAGRLAEGIGLAREAVRRAGAGSAAARRTHPRLALASMLLDAGRLDEARAVLRAAREEVEALGHTAWTAGPALLSARLQLAAHHPAEAVDAAEAGLLAADALGTHLFSAVGAAVLGAAALRRGDLREAAAQVEGEHARLACYAGSQGSVRCALLAAQVMEAQGHPRRAMASLAGVYPMIERNRALLVLDPTTAAWLVRLALRVDDRPRAEAVTTAIEKLAGDNPDVVLAAAAAAHARGLLDGDVESLSAAVGLAADAYARASAREDLGVALAPMARADEAISTFTDALAGYQATGAARDAARVRSRLRLLGVRHRHWVRNDHAKLGWDSLTGTENSVARLVAQGMTNRQVAQQMFISAHTVAFHLRQIFRKLDIGSRVDLTRFVVEEDRLHDRSQRSQD
ncbi:LuxR C-terminal-related transcriptional regulator [Nonomuraea sp. NPDC003804]|uniref:helix-turn-helix transcriptional regulator n=1 Tax=Nonomuraea sp. NPDC003804 TaxID=3154547 RepID=UPI0033A4D822